MPFSPRARSQSTLLAAATATPSPCNPDKDGLAKLEYKDGAVWKTVPDPFYISKGTTVTFRAVKTAGSTACDVQWSDLASGTGNEKSKKFDTVSSSDTDYKKVTATCVNAKTAKVIVFDIAFDQYGWKTGFSTPSGTSTIHYLLTASVTPKVCVDKVGAIKTTTPDLIRLDNELRDPVTGKVSVKVFGKQSSGTTINNAYVQAYDKTDTNKVLATTRGTVVIPTSQTHQVGPIQFSNGYDSPIKLWSRGIADVTITIFDQFGIKLGSIYDGQFDVREFFTDNDHGCGPGGQLPPFFPDGATISVPTGILSNGIILDRVGFEKYVLGVDPLNPLNPAQLNAWINGTLQVNMGVPPGPFNNAFPAFLPWVKGIQSLRVHGHDLTNTFKREIKTFRLNWAPPTFPIQITDE